MIDQQDLTEFIPNPLIDESLRIKRPFGINPEFETQNNDKLIADTSKRLKEKGYIQFYDGIAAVLRRDSGEMENGGSLSYSVNDSGQWIDKNNQPVELAPEEIDAIVNNLPNLPLEVRKNVMRRYLILRDQVFNDLTGKSDMPAANGTASLYRYRPDITACLINYAFRREIAPTNGQYYNLSEKKDWYNMTPAKNAAIDEAIRLTRQFAEDLPAANSTANPS